MSAVAVCKLADVPVSGALGVIVDATPVAVVRDSDGVLHAIRDICSHADVALSEGEVDGCTLECWLHGSRFNVRTGDPSGPPATIPVAVYPVKIDGEDVLVSVTNEVS